MSRKPINENFLHDSFVLYTSWKQQFTRLDGAQTKEIISMIFEYADTGTFTESTDAIVNILFDTIKRELDINWQCYGETKINNRLNTLIRCIKRKEEISKDTIEFVRTIPDKAKSYLKEHEVSDADIAKLFIDR